MKEIVHAGIITKPPSIDVALATGFPKALWETW
jgi:hypothetical protein